jgi:hypothetical protein
MRWRLVLIGSVGLLLLGLQAHGFAQSVDESAQQVPSLFLTPSEGPPATRVTANGNGYCESGTVTLRWGDGTRLVAGQADEDGDISLTFSVPEAALGTYTVTSDSICQGSTRRAETSFKVVRMIRMIRMTDRQENSHHRQNQHRQNHHCRYHSQDDHS